MEICYSYHPFEVIRQLTAFGKTFVSDLDLRFPESRKRRALELERLGMQEALDAQLLREFDRTPQVISILDWPIVFEWNERWLQARLLGEIKKRLAAAQVFALEEPSALLEVLITRLQEMEDLIQKKPLPREASLLRLLYFRWIFAGIREEAEYLLKRLDRKINE